MTSFFLAVKFKSSSRRENTCVAKAGDFYLESPTLKLKPTQRCSKCWELTPKVLSDRMHQCSNLKGAYIEDRDVNTAQVNLIWARGQDLTSLDADSQSSTDCGSMRQLGAKKRAISQTKQDGNPVPPRSG